MYSYLNLNLLYVVDQFLFPLFYYKNKVCTEVYSPTAVYSPITLKSVFDCNWSEHINHLTLTKKYYNFIFKGIHIFDKNSINVTEKNFFKTDFTGTYIMDKSEPFKLSKETKAFLKSNIRINLKNKLTCI